ncbi:hypothetical protein CCP3SC1_2430003 [Gammaproteobacteria bacterium]
MIPILTREAKKFIGALTLDTLSQKRAQPTIPHISLAQQADLIVIAPATANVIGRIANGLADDLLTETVMAATCPVLIAPAMNTGMWNNPLVQRNIQTLKDIGYHFIDTDEGELACGLVGKGRLARIPEILTAIESLI